jgi:glycosyltransferase involved in cell wall biosynthesis
MEIKPLVTIFIPVYNGEIYLSETIESLKKQIFKNFEVIFIDDQSTDSSFEILKIASHDDERFRLHRTPENLGNAACVLKYGMFLVKGKYFVYSSQDDLFSADWLNEMINKALITDADATIPELVLYNQLGSHKYKPIIGLNGDKNIELSGREAFLYSLNWTIAGNALWKTDLITRSGWYDFSFNADEFSVRNFFINCKKVVFSNGVFYYRQDNPNAITKKLSSQSFSQPYTNFYLWKLCMVNNFDVDLQSKILHQSINDLIHYVAIAYTGKHRDKIPLLKGIFREYKRGGVYMWLIKNSDKNLKNMINIIAVQSYLLLVLVSLAKTYTKSVVKQAWKI